MTEREQVEYDRRGAMTNAPGPPGGPRWRCACGGASRPEHNLTARNPATGVVVDLRIACLGDRICEVCRAITAAQDEDASASENSRYSENEESRDA